ncbi:3245_t:CDS:1, partial [Acaulospora morrowiae]
VSIWTKILKDWDKQLSRLDKNILLIVDGAPVHCLEENIELKYIRIEFLLPNAITHIQPCDQGIIHSFKCFYKKGFISNRIDAYDSIYNKPNENLPAFTILDAIYLVANAWKSVTHETIANCWKRTGILPISNNNNELPIQFQDIEHEQVDELNKMIAKLPIDNPLSANEFLHLDD